MSNVINVHTMPWSSTRSPQGRFEVAQRDVSLALGGQKDVGLWGGGHPFDVAMVSVPQGAANWPMHRHTTQWEFYIVLSGTGELRSEERATPVGPGDCCLLPPGVPHQVSNTGEEPLIYYVIADNPPADISYYPDSDKWMIKPQRKWFKMTEVDYYQGED